LEKKTPIKKIKNKKKKGNFSVKLKIVLQLFLKISLFIKEYQPFSLSIKYSFLEPIHSWLFIMTKKPFSIKLLLLLKSF